MIATTFYPNFIPKVNTITAGTNTRGQCNNGNVCHLHTNTDTWS